jgi:hypothetical protein
VECAALERRLQLAGEHNPPPHGYIQYVMVLKSPSTGKFSGICIPPRKPRLHLQMSQSKNLCLRTKKLLVATIGTVHKTNFPGHFTGQARGIVRSIRGIATIGRSLPHIPNP